MNEASVIYPLVANGFSLPALGAVSFSSGTLIPNVSRKPRRPNLVTTTALLCFILSVQPRSK